MAISRPIAAFPNKNTIDVSILNNFSVIIQGASAVVVAYEALIYDLGSSKLLFTTGKTSLSTPLVANDTLEFSVPIISALINGNSYYWKIKLYQTNSTMFIANGKTTEDSTTTVIFTGSYSGIKKGMNLIIGDETRSISFYDYSLGKATVSAAFSAIPVALTEFNIYSDFCESLNFPFFAKKTPAVSIVSNPVAGGSRVGKFYGTYSQEQDTQIRWYQFYVYDINDKLLESTEKTYNASLYYKYEKFENGKTYKVKCVVGDINGNETESSLLSIPISYQSIDFNTGVRVVIDPVIGTVRINWDEDRYSEGVSTGTYSFDTISGEQFLNIGTGVIDYTKVSMDELSINESDFTVLTDIVITDKSGGNIISVSNKTKNANLSIKNYKINYVLNGITTFLTDIVTSRSIGETTDGVSVSGVGYLWDDSAIWDDSMIWTETTPFEQRYKVAMYPTNATILKV